MLQQTRVETAVRRFELFVARFPSIERLAEATLEDVLAEWSGLGYYSRARALHAGARAILERHGGQFPRSFEEALRIPGVGPYTAAAVQSIAYDLPVAAIDGNVERVACRMLGIAGNPRSPLVRREIRSALERILRRVRPSQFNQALMELGALVCKPSSPECGRCPVAAWCKARGAGDPLAYPAGLPRRRALEVTLEAIVLRDRDRFYLERQPEGKILGGLWIFPMAETRSRRSSRNGERSSLRPAPRFVRELELRSGRAIEAVEFLGCVRHSVTFRRMRVFAFEARPAPGAPVAAAAGAWATPEDLGTRIPVSSLTLKILRLFSDGDWETDAD